MCLPTFYEMVTKCNQLNYERYGLHTCYSRRRDPNPRGGCCGMRNMEVIFCNIKILSYLCVVVGAVVVLRRCCCPALLFAQGFLFLLVQHPIQYSSISIVDLALVKVDVYIRNCVATVTESCSDSFLWDVK